LSQKSRKAKSLVISRSPKNEVIRSEGAEIAKVARERASAFARHLKHHLHNPLGWSARERRRAGARLRSRFSRYTKSKHRGISSRAHDAHWVGFKRARRAGIQNPLPKVFNAAHHINEKSGILRSQKLADAPEGQCKRVDREIPLPEKSLELGRTLNIQGEHFFSGRQSVPIQIKSLV
jgi:hypothetical protein